MQQRVNFMRRHLLPQKTHLGVTSIITTTLGLVAIFFAISIYAELVITRLQDELSDLTVEKNRLEQKFAVPASLHSTADDKNPLEVELQRLVDAKAALLANRVPLPGRSEQPFSATLQIIAEARIPGIRINEVDINDFKHYLFLAGSADRSTPGLIPEYVENLNRHFSIIKEPLVVKRIGLNREAKQTAFAVPSNDSITFRLQSAVKPGETP